VPTLPAASFQTYTNPSFTIDYPQGWKATESGTGGTSNAISFTDATDIYQFEVTLTPDPGGALSANQLVQTGLGGAKGSLTNSQPVTVPTTATVGGQTWSQGAISGTTTQKGQSVTVELDVLAYEANSQAYVIVYGTVQQIFDLATTTYFQPMLQSFQFK
jgi:hypothetical protein